MLRSTSTPRVRAPRRWLLPACALAGALCLSSPAAAAVINIAPTMVVIARPGESGSLMLRNDADQPVRFQVSAFRWSNSASGEMTLEPTRDLIFFPSLFTLAPHQARRLRVAASVRAVDRELSYRLMIEQLPASDAASGQGVQMLVRASVPVFVQPPTLTVRVTLDGLALADGAASFDLRNTGTVHLVMTEAVLRGRLRSGADAPEQRIKGWYLLPAESRRYSVPVPPESCREWTAMRVSVTFANGFKEPLTEETALPPGSCGG
jgi:fimbrial chaperone protein